MAAMAAIFVLFALLTGTTAIQEVDIDGPLGSGHWFDWTIDRRTTRNGVDFIGTVDDVDDSNDCCEECRAAQTFTDRFGVLDMEMYDYSSHFKHCYCLAKDSSGQRPVSHEVEYVADVCGSVDVEGGVGEGRVFNFESVEFLGWAPDVEDRSGCCQGCEDVYGEAQMFEFGEFVINGCYCYKPIPGTTPVSEIMEFYAGICSADK